MSGIRLENVSKYFAKGGATIRALDGVTLDAPAGALTLLRGPSGCGKTTLINVAAGLTRPTRGRVFLDGQAVETLSPAARTALRARKAAVVFQMFHLVPYLTAFENVLLPTLAAPDPGAAARANALIEDLGLGHRRAHFPGEMSAGERQRCALARALLNNPGAILADEPTGNLDQDSAALVLAMLERRRNDGAAVLLVSHQHLPHIRPDFEYQLKDGRLTDPAPK